MTALNYADDATPHEKATLDKIAALANEVCLKRGELIKLIEEETQTYGYRDDPKYFRGTIVIPELSIDSYGSWMTDNEVTPDSIWEASDQYC